MPVRGSYYLRNESFTVKIERIGLCPGDTIISGHHLKRHLIAYTFLLLIAVSIGLSDPKLFFM